MLCQAPSLFQQPIYNIISLGRVAFWKNFHRWLVAFILCLASVTMALLRFRGKMQSLPTSMPEFQTPLGTGIPSNEGGWELSLAAQTKAKHKAESTSDHLPPHCRPQIKLISGCWRRVIKITWRKTQEGFCRSSFHHGTLGKTLPTGTLSQGLSSSIWVDNALFPVENIGHEQILNQT